MLTVDLPDLGEGVTEGEMVRWLVNVGDQVEADQVIAEIMTDKATVEVPTPYSGKVLELKASEGDIIPIETPLLILEGEASSAKENKSEQPESSASVESTREQVDQNNPQNAEPLKNGSALPPTALRVLASPSTRRLAREKNIDINKVKGSGPSGRVTREDVLSGGQVATASSSVSKMAIPQLRSQGVNLEEREPIRGIRRKIVESMQLSKQVIPHFTLMDEAIVTDLVKVRTEMKSQANSYGVKVTYLPFVIKAMIAACRKFPMMNASIDDHNQEIVYKKYFNVGFAADTPNGLVVPVVKNADQKSILELSAEILELAKKARDGKLTPADLKEATITVTNIGSIGGNYATPIINHPQVAILGMYKMVDKPVFKEGQFVPEKVMNFTITADHRLIDGAVAAKFLSEFIGRIESPSKMFLEMI